MKKFLQLTKKECRDIYPELKGNADNLFVSAKLLANHGQFGHATGLLIIGAEEYIRSFFLFLHGHGFDVFSTKEIQTIFLSHHRSRYLPLRESYSIWIILSYLLKHVSVTYSDADIASLRSRIKLFQANNESKWWEKADHLKGQVFCYDYLNRLLTPSDFGETDYKNAFVKTNVIPVEINELSESIHSLSHKDLHRYLRFFDDMNLPLMIKQATGKLPKKASKEITGFFEH